MPVSITRLSSHNRPFRSWLLTSSCSIRHLQGRNYSSKPSRINILGDTYPTDSYTNVTPAIISKLNTRLTDKPAHPLNTLKSLIESHFADYTHFSQSFPPPSSSLPSSFLSSLSSSSSTAAALSPLVTPEQNFDSLSFPADHPGRAQTDSYYVNKNLMLRTHTSAHEVEVFASGYKKWLLTADVFRRDEIDASHYPVFHQMEGARLFDCPSPLPSSSSNSSSSDSSSSSNAMKELKEDNARLESELTSLADLVKLTDTAPHASSENPYQKGHDPVLAELVVQNLKYNLSLLLFKLFSGAAGTSKSNPLQIRWIPAYFPFTSPSYEVEVLFRDRWLEILGCGVVQQQTLVNAKIPNQIGWAFGLGLERIAMILYSIPDIRLFWTSDERFLSQFQEGKVTTFTPYSKYPGIARDVSFWTPDSALEKGGEEREEGVKRFHANDFCDLVREVAGDLVEEVMVIDQFVHPKTQRESLCYRISYRSMDRNLESIEINALTNLIKERATKELGVELR